MNNVVLRRAALVALGALSASSILYASDAAAEESKGFAYELPVSIYNANYRLNAFQVAIKLDTRDLISSGKLKADGSDLRVVDVETGAILPHYAHGLDSASTEIWVRAPKLNALFYTDFLLVMGNPDAEYTGDPNAVFEMWDDFNGADTGKWTKSCGNSEAKFSQALGKGSFEWTSSGMFAFQHGFSSAYHYRVETEVLSRTGSNATVLLTNTKGRTGYGLSLSGGGIVSTTSAPTDACNAVNNVTDQGTPPYGLYGFAWAPQKQYGSNPSSTNQRATDTTYTASSTLQLLIGGVGNGAGGVDLEWIRVRRFIADEPVATTDLSKVAARTLSAPSITGIEAGDTELSVSFEYGDSAPLAQSFSASCGGKTATGTESPLAVSGLSSGTSYDCTVSVTNNLGEVVVSETESARTLGGAGAGDGDGDGAGAGDGDDGTPGGDGDGDGTPGGDGDSDGEDGGDSGGEDSEGKKSSGGGCSVPDQGASLSSAVIMGLALLFSRRRKGKSA